MKADEWLLVIHMLFRLIKLYTSVHVFVLQKLLGNVEIVDYDYETGEPKRGPDGLCVVLPDGMTWVASASQPLCS